MTSTPLDLAEEPFDADDEFLDHYPVVQAAAPGTDDLEEDQSPADVTAAVVKRPSIERSTPDPAALGDLVSRFRTALDSAHVSLPLSEMMAALAGMLSSQFLLLAGPSGTGKSTLANALMRFFVPTDASAIIEARRQLIGPEDISGIVRAITPDRFARGPELHKLLRLGGGAADSASPALTVEEINLSPVEGYLSPLTHGLSAPSQEAVPWPLHRQSQEVDDVPPSIILRPFPRLLGTINVDATAMAPSPKVAARACVLLLLPSMESHTVGESISALVVPPAAISLDDAAMKLLGDPLSVIQAHTKLLNLAQLEQSIQAVIDAVGAAPGVTRTVTRRQLAQMAIYSSWFVLLAEGFAGALQAAGEGNPMALDSNNQPLDAYAVASQNAYMHFVLPSLPPEDFTGVMEHLSSGKSGLELADAPEDRIGSVLGSRFARLLGDASGTGRFLDFWDRLS